MGYDARWTATDQVPQRADRRRQLNGQPFGRFDSLDPSDGGDTRAHSLSGEWHGDGDGGRTRGLGLRHRYRLDLFSNFTYALERPADGDQFTQQRPAQRLRPRRQPGLRPHARRAATRAAKFGAAAAPRPHPRRPVRQRGAAASPPPRATTRCARRCSASTAQTARRARRRWLRAVLGLRADHVRTAVDAPDARRPTAGSASDTLVSPKLIADRRARSRKTEFFFNAGRGFHSNDARGTTATSTRDRRPGRHGAAAGGLARLRARRAHRGAAGPAELARAVEARLRLRAGLRRRRRRHRGQRRQHAARRRVEQPLDAGALAAVRRRPGLDARALSTDRRPHPERGRPVASVAATVRDLGPWSASLQWRYLGPGALIEDNSVRSFVVAHRPTCAWAASFGRDVEADARRLQPVRPQGQRHPVLLRVAAARRGGAGGRPPRAPGRAAQHEAQLAGRVLRAVWGVRAPHCVQGIRAPWARSRRGSGTRRRGRHRDR